MLPVLGLLAAAAPTAEASDILFTVSGPVAIFVDGKKATLTGKLQQTVTGLAPGSHRIRVAGVFGKTLFEADMEVPDNTMTWAEWDKGTLRVLRTEWLQDRQAQAAEPVAEEKDMAVAAPTPEPEPEPVAAAPATPAPVETPVAQAPVAPEPVAPVAPVAAAPVAATTAVIAPVVVDPDATPVAATPSIEEAPATLGAEPKLLTVEATEGTMVEIKANGRSVFILVDGDTFKVSDASGLELALKNREAEK